MINDFDIDEWMKNPVTVQFFNGIRELKNCYIKDLLGLDLSQNNANLQMCKISGAISILSDIIDPDVKILFDIGRSYESDI